MPNRQGSRTSIFELGPKERFDMIKEVNDHRQTINRRRKFKRTAVIGPGFGSEITFVMDLNFERLHH